MSISDESALGDSGLHAPTLDKTDGKQDPLWQKIQKKTFTAWCNIHLKKQGVQIVEIDRDFRDGRSLLKLLQVISGEKISPPERGNLRIHLVNNVRKALDFLKSKDMKLVGMHAEDIVDGNLTMTLGMIWTIILRFAIKDISVGEMSAKDGLLLWCQRKTKGYKHVNVQNFHMSFRDGLAFCALIHRHRPDLIDFESLKKGNDMENLALAFDVAATHLDIPRMLDVEDMLSSIKPDEKAVMTYVSSYYHAFSSTQQAETAAKRIGKVLTVNQENEKMMHYYETLATDLLEWINQKIPEFQNHSRESSLAGATEQLENFRTYMRTQKPPKAAEKAQLETHYNTLQTKLRISSRPAYTPTDGKTVSDVAEAWRRLEHVEKEFEEFLLSELKRLERLEVIAGRFELKASKHEEWMQGKPEKLIDNQFIGLSLAEVTGLKRQHEAFMSDTDTHGLRLQKLHEMANELEKQQYFNSESIKRRAENIETDWTNLQNLAQVRKEAIELAIKEQQHLDQLRLEFAKKASALDTWMIELEEDLTDSIKAHSIQEVEELLTEHQQVCEQVVDKRQQLEELEDIQGRLDRGSDETNPYTSLTYESLKSRFDLLQGEGLQEREERLRQEMENQQSNETLRIQFSEGANKFGPWLESKSLELTQLGLSITGSLEDHKQRLFDFSQELADSKVTLDDLENINATLQTKLVFDNPHTEFKIETIRTSWEAVQLQIGRSINEIDNQILIRDETGVSEEQLEEFRKSFQYFDKDKSCRLDKFEFRSCLLSLGYKLCAEGEEDPELDSLLHKVDPNETGFIALEAFIDFMTQETVDKDTAEQVAESFKILAGDKPFIMPDEIKRELPDVQAEYCLKHMSPYTAPGAPEGALDYSDFASALYGASDL
ncbi:Alpha-actinin, sarcomeric isoform X1 [Oopsacas minuta]|uniref:Alpha-actinin, sarcomeric isoform X1 n=1 Tax=Oopsacas minuta TaxID=111878 RepID=A0AAV7KEC4_9METZ|nr:Alpha-actinin, sarcomeric isoform X1 [Oopsacas minuta]